ncbi:dihydroneopterin aldolase [Brevibacillus porteri]|uniref:7,8-dihydroneopterin aldolase n=1 Tax=Brevibacillus porteri TaxID=2126350 RepID=A0ABX5FK23_9BACL|nr:dihydroneopterin aldolase [Brevibacillus porteri]MED1802321.1 dihydroneopterin aldolase [Brevibacillus porteri]MED2130833.1 dihydroneopterin aldolase [Brevibacillus porteri]MED2745676.1 dihydroneopterin aldolase [Brevibacillus porteri]MED2818095.1 dihydroneopterin aldolase [Brevibacillus porteri]MED2896936.1 dihydroneopterin aldolase [Brevibacillus porteri]
MDKIYFNGMSFYGYHGVFGAEAELGQRFYVDLELSLDLSKAGASDNLHDTVNYADIFTCVQKIVEGERFQLVEKLTAVIAERLLTQFPLHEVKAKVTKPNPPINGHYESVAIEMIRRREDFAS